MYMYSFINIRLRPLLLGSLRTKFSFSDGSSLWQTWLANSLQLLYLLYVCYIICFETLLSPSLFPITLLLFKCIFFPNKYFTLLMSYCLLMDLNGHRWYLKSPKKADVKIESPHTCQGRLHPKWHMLYGLSLSLEQGGSPFPKYFTDGYLGKCPGEGN